MDLNLTPVEVRILGSLVEKEATTPEHYPLSLNALVNACNQKSNRDPVMSLEEDEVADALQRLQDRGLAARISGVSHRVEKYRHRLGEAFNFDRREQAAMCVLMLRGPQTVGEIRGRSQRLYEFDDLEAVEHTLEHLAERDPPLIVRLPRRPGEKGPRSAHLLSGDVDIPDEPPAATRPRSPLEERVSTLEAELAALREDFESFRQNFE